MKKLVFDQQQLENYKRIDLTEMKNYIQSIKDKKYDLSLPIMKAHGVPEISQYLSGSINLKECISKGQQVTRNYVKRQITWWKSSKFYNSTIFKDFPSNIDLESLNFKTKLN